MKGLPDSDVIRRVKQSLASNAKRAYEIRLQTGNGGNLSGRIPGTDLIIIKASGCSFEQCRVENLITVRLDGEIVDGDGAPSRELATHLAIYRARPEARGVFHCHSPWAIACAGSAETIPTVTDHARSKLGRIPVLRVPDGSTKATADAVEAMLAVDGTLRAFVQERHGTFSLAGTIELARYQAELVEETAQIAWAMALGRNVGVGHRGAEDVSRP